LQWLEQVLARLCSDGYCEVGIVGCVDQTVDCGDVREEEVAHVEVPGQEGATEVVQGGHGLLGDRGSLPTIL